jgi:hypothetical protein
MAARVPKCSSFAELQLRRGLGLFSRRRQAALDPALGVASFAQCNAMLTGFSDGGVGSIVVNFAPFGSDDQLTLGGIEHTA